MTQALSMEQVFLNKLNEIIENHLHNEQFGVAEISRAMSLSRSGIHRKLKSITKKSLTQYIREYRLQKAMDMLKHHEATAAEISFRVGFSSPAYFNKCFHAFYGYPPGEARQSVTQEPVDAVPEPEPAAIIRKVRKQKTFRIISIVFLVALILLLLFYFSDPSFFRNYINSTNDRINDRDKSILVLPFKNLSNDPENQYFADGVMEDILNHLFRISELRVVSRTTAEQYRGSNLTAPEIARELQVGYVLEGSVQRDELKARIFVQLIDARRDQHVWTEKYDRELTDIFVVQASIARNIARELETVLSEKEIEQIAKIPTQNQEAYDNYLRGRFFWNKRTEDGIKKSITCFERSIALDRDFALAYAGLANSYLTQAGWGWCPIAQCFDKARNLALRTLEIDESLAEAHAILGSILRYEWKWEDARKEFILAIECNPRDATCRQYYAEFLIDVGEEEEARRQIDMAREFDPLSVIIRLMSGYFYFYEGKTREALDEAGVIQEIDSTFVQTYWLLERIYIQEKEGLKLLGVYESLTHIPGSLQSADGYKKAYAESGIDGVNEYVQEIVLKRQYPHEIALRYAMLKDKENTLKWLERASAMHYIGNIYIVPEFEFIRSDPRTWEILKRSGLSRYFNNLSVEKNLP